MKKIYFLNILILSTVLSLSVHSQNSRLSQLLWGNVQGCYANFEDMDGDGELDYDKIDDSKNGYLMVSGSFPTCGCTCSSTVGAYRNNKGKYTTLQYDTDGCSWTKYISSNKELNNILPLNFGVNDFTNKQIKIDSNESLFFVNVEIPRKGTDTKLKINTIPFGLKPYGEDGLSFGYDQSNRFHETDLIYHIERLTYKVQSDETFKYLLKGEFNKISVEDKVIIAKILGTNIDDYKPKKQIQSYLSELKKVYNAYCLLDYDEIILGWDRNKSRFYIKEKIKKEANITFKEFLKKQEFWAAIC